jgi:hypothetical protein
LLSSEDLPRLLLFVGCSFLLFELRVGGVAFGRAGALSVLTRAGAWFVLELDPPPEMFVSGLLEGLLLGLAWLFGTSRFRVTDGACRGVWVRCSVAGFW